MQVLLVEDHVMINKGLACLLISHFEPVEIIYAKDNHSALYQLEKQPNTELIITDLELNRGDWAINLIKQAISKFPAIKIIVHTKHEDKVILDNALKAGALAYLSKKESEESLIECIKNVLEKGRTVSQSETRINQRAASIFKNSFLSPEEKFHQLTAREKEVALAIYHKENRKQTAKRLFIEESTLKTHTHHIYQKLRIDSKAGLCFFFKMNPQLI